MTDKTILVVGTYDTREDQLLYMAERIHAQGGGVLTMDVSVLGAARAVEPPKTDRPLIGMTSLGSYLSPSSR